MFGSDSDKPSDGPAPIGPASMIGRDNVPNNMPTPLPAPDTSISPTPNPAVSEPAGRYLDGSNPPSSPGIIGGSSFIETGDGAPPAKSKRPASPASPPQAPDELIKIKQQALQNLAPLIDKLDQSPEERFKTLMMMIQASDNPEYLDEAYTAANGIKDEKDKAQALLDVVNEINYFTQSSNGEAKS